MALFQKKPQVSSSAPLYTLGLSKTLMVVGLGNAGEEYKNTRHNIGFEAVDAFAASQDMAGWLEKKDHKCLQTTGNVGSTRVIVIKPTTFMNLSGEAVQSIAHFYKINPQDILVVHDELDMPFGQLRTRVGGSSAGNNGIKSIIQHIGDDFPRLRIGINSQRPTAMKEADFVLAKFNSDEQKQIPKLLKETNSVIIEFVVGGKLSHDTRNFIID